MTSYEQFKRAVTHSYEKILEELQYCRGQAKYFNYPSIDVDIFKDDLVLWRTIQKIEELREN